MDTATLQLVLYLVAGILAIIALVQSRGQLLTAWAVLLTDIALLLPRVLGK